MLERLKKILNLEIIVAILMGIIFVAFLACILLSPPQFDKLVKHFGISTSYVQKILSEAEEKNSIFITDQNLTGIITKNSQGEDCLAWVIKSSIPTQSYIVYGEIYDHNGQNLSEANIWRLKQNSVTRSSKLPGNKDYFSTQDMLTLANKLSGFEHFEHQSDKIIFAFFDPDCSSCTKAMTDLDSLKTDFVALKVNVRWLPVSILSQDRTKAAQALIYGRKSPANDFKPDAETLNKIDMNTAALVYSVVDNRPSVPYFVWQGEDEIEAYIGTPSLTHWKIILSSVEVAK